MKRLLVVLFILSLLVSVSSAQVYIGSRQAGMGGTGVASAVGLNAVAFNPAGLMRGPSGEFLLSLGAASQGIDQIISSFGEVTDPAQFMVDNYGTNLDADGSVSGLLGLNVAHIGLSVLIPNISANLSKPANSLGGSVTAMANTAIVLTAGHTFTIPGVPIANLDVGANAKLLNSGFGRLLIPGTPAPSATVEATQIYATGSGYGFDIGARSNVEIPMLTDFSVGVALRDISQTVKYSPKSRTDKYTGSATGGEPTITKGTESAEADVDVTYPTSLAIGCAGTIPGIGLKVAADVTSVSGGTNLAGTGIGTDYSVTNIGFEYPLLLNTLILRAGLASSSDISLTTLGAKINIPFITLELATMIDGKNSKNTSYVVDAGVAF